MTYTAEIRDIGGTGVGTAVRSRLELLEAVRTVARVTQEDWAGAWRIIDEETNKVVLEGDSDQHKTATPSSGAEAEEGPQER